jgi:tRNA-Thr(GGU) m(6)t(6)A37 methyltransferase TsaA
METTVELTAIGVIRCGLSKKYQAQTQSSESSSHCAQVVFSKGFNTPQMTAHLQSFSHIWLIFYFHQSPHWKPMVLPPSRSKQKVGVWASRSPYRPNHLGMSVVKLLAVEKSFLRIESSDLIDGTPVLDIKPYLVDADCIPGASKGWKAEDPAPKEVEFSKAVFPYFEKDPFLKSFIERQLKWNLGSPYKRIHWQNSLEGVLSYQHLRIFFTIDEQSVFVKDIKNDFP